MRSSSRMRITMAWVLIALLALTSSSAEPFSVRPHSAVLVVAPLGEAERHQLEDAMPVRLKIAACDSDAGVLHRQWRQAGVTGCDCAAALDVALRRLTTWARGARGMASAVVTAMNTTSSSADPIVLVASLPYDMRYSRMLRRAPVLPILVRTRRLLWKQGRNIGDLENINSNEITEDTESLRADDTNNDALGDNIFENPFMRKEKTSNTLPDVAKNGDPPIPFGMETDVHPLEHSTVLAESAKKLEKDIFGLEEEMNGAQKDVVDEYDISRQDDQQNQTTKEPHKCGEECQCSKVDKNSHECCGRGSTPKLRPVADPSQSFPADLHRVLLSEWLRAIALGTQLGLPMEVPLELPQLLSLGLGQGEGQETPQPPLEGAVNHVHVGEESLKMPDVQTPLVTATRMALQRLQAMSRKHGSFLVIRSVTPLISKELPDLLKALGIVDVGSGDDGGDATDRLVIVLGACPKTIVQKLADEFPSDDSTLHVFARGAGAELLRRATTLQELGVAMRGAIRTPVKLGIRSGGIEELVTIEPPRARDTSPALRLRITRTFSPHCNGISCFLAPLKRHHRQIQRREMEGNASHTPLRNKRQHEVFNDSIVSEGDASKKKKKRFPDPLWRLLEEMADGDHHDKSIPPSARFPRNSQTDQHASGNEKKMDDKDRTEDVIKKLDNKEKVEDKKDVAKREITNDKGKSVENNKDDKKEEKKIDNETEKPQTKRDDKNETATTKKSIKANEGPGERIEREDKDETANKENVVTFINNEEKKNVSSVNIGEQTEIKPVNIEEEREVSPVNEEKRDNPDKREESVTVTKDKDLTLEPDVSKQNSIEMRKEGIEIVKSDNQTTIHHPEQRIALAMHKDDETSTRLVKFAVTPKAQVTVDFGYMLRSDPKLLVLTLMSVILVMAR